MLCVLPFVLFYGEENWRGRSALAKVKEEARAKGYSLDWADYKPKKVPDDQNFFAASNMTEWFEGRGGNSLSKRLDMANFNAYLRHHTWATVAEVRIVPPDTAIKPQDADLILRYDYPNLSLSATLEPEVAKGAADVIPIIALDGVPLTDAVKNLARQAGIQYSFAPGAIQTVGANGTAIPEPTISQRLQNVTAMQALRTVLSNYNLVLVTEPS